MDEENPVVVVEPDGSMPIDPGPGGSMAGLEPGPDTLSA